MTSINRPRRWLSALFRSGSTDSQQHKSTPGLNEAAAEPEVEIVYLVDARSSFDLQLLLLSIDALAEYGCSDSPLRVRVVHRESVTAATRQSFDGVPGLVCEHTALDSVVSRDDERAMGTHWREYAALLVARLVQSQHYLVLDESAVCMRPLHRSQLLSDGLALSQWEPLERHRELYDGCRSLLGLGPVSGEGLSTLPAIFSQQLALQTLQQLAGAGGSGTAESKLIAACEARVPWSASMLYSLACLRDLHRFHRPANWQGQFGALHGDANVWFDEDDLTDWDPVRWRALATHGQFLVFKCKLADRARYIASCGYALLR